MCLSSSSSSAIGASADKSSLMGQNHIGGATGIGAASGGAGITDRRGNTRTILGGQSGAGQSGGPVTTGGFATPVRRNP